MSTNLLKNLATSISDKCRQAHEKYLQEEHQKYLQGKKQYIQDVMYALQQDLFHVMNGNTYPRLVTISSASNIRMHGWRTTPSGTVIYQYELDKELYTDMPKRISELILFNVQRKINLDIMKAQQELKNIYLPEVIRLNFLFLYRGVQIISMKDIGTSVLMEVATNVQP